MAKTEKRSGGAKRPPASKVSVVTGGKREPAPLAAGGGVGGGGENRSLPKETAALANPEVMRARSDGRSNPSLEGELNKRRRLGGHGPVGNEINPTMETATSTAIPDALGQGGFETDVGPDYRDYQAEGEELVNAHQSDGLEEDPQDFDWVALSVHEPNRTDIPIFREASDRFGAAEARFGESLDRFIDVLKETQTQLTDLSIAVHARESTKLRDMERRIEASFVQNHEGREAMETRLRQYAEAAQGVFSNLLMKLSNASSSNSTSRARSSVAAQREMQA